mgnify:CR=1 FL=1
MAKLADLQLGTLKTRAFSFVRRAADGSEKTVSVRIRILNQQQLDQAKVDAAAYVNRLAPVDAKGLSHDELIEDARVVELLSRALCDPDSDTKEPDIWASPAHLRTLLSPSELAGLHKAYEDHVEDTGPIVHKLSPELFEATLKVVAEEASADPLLLFVSSIRKAFVVTTALELMRLRTDKSLLTSESSEPEMTS